MSKPLYLFPDPLPTLHLEQSLNVSNFDKKQSEEIRTESKKLTTLPEEKDLQFQEFYEEAIAYSDHAIIVDQSTERFLSWNCGFRLGTVEFDGIRVQSVAKDLKIPEETLDTTRKKNILHVLQTANQQVKHGSLGIIGLQEMPYDQLEPKDIEATLGKNWRCVKFNEFKSPHHLILLDDKKPSSRAQQLPVSAPSNPGPSIPPKDTELPEGTVYIYKTPPLPLAGLPGLARSFSQWVSPPSPQYSYAYRHQGRIYRGSLQRPYGSMNIDPIALIQKMLSDTPEEQKQPLLVNHNDYSTSPESKLLACVLRQTTIPTEMIPIIINTNHFDFNLPNDYLSPAIRSYLWDQEKKEIARCFRWEVLKLHDKESKADLAYVNVWLPHTDDPAVNERIVKEIVHAIFIQFPTLSKVIVAGDMNTNRAQMEVKSLLPNVTNVLSCREYGNQIAARPDAMLEFTANQTQVTVLPILLFHPKTGENLQGKKIGISAEIAAESKENVSSFFQVSAFSEDLAVCGIKPRDFETALYDLLKIPANMHLPGYPHVRRSEDENRQLCLGIYQLPLAVKQWIDQRGIIPETTSRGREPRYRDDEISPYGDPDGITSGYYHYDPKNPFHRLELMGLLFEGCQETDLATVSQKAYLPLFDLLALEIFFSEYESSSSQYSNLARIKKTLNDHTSCEPLINRFLKKRFDDKTLLRYAHFFVWHFDVLNKKLKVKNPEVIIFQVQNLCKGCSPETFHAFYQAIQCYLPKDYHTQNSLYTELLLSEQVGEKTTDLLDESKVKPTTDSKELSYLVERALQLHCVLKRNAPISLSGEEKTHFPAKVAKQGQQSNEYKILEARIHQELDQLKDQFIQTGLTEVFINQTLADSKELLELPPLKDFHQQNSLSKILMPYYQPIQILVEKKLLQRARQVGKELDPLYAEAQAVASRLLTYFRPEVAAGLKQILQIDGSPTLLKEPKNKIPMITELAELQKSEIARTMVIGQLLKACTFSLDSCYFKNQPLKEGIASSDTLKEAYQRHHNRLTFLCNLYLKKSKDITALYQYENKITWIFQQPIKEKISFLVRLKALKTIHEEKAFFIAGMALCDSAKTYNEVEQIRVICNDKYHNPVATGLDVHKKWSNFNQYCNRRLIQLGYTSPIVLPQIHPDTKSNYCHYIHALVEPEDVLASAAALDLQLKKDNMLSFAQLCQELLDNQPKTDTRGHPPAEMKTQSGWNRVIQLINCHFQLTNGSYSPYKEQNVEKVTRELKEKLEEVADEKLLYDKLKALFDAYQFMVNWAEPVQEVLLSPRKNKNTPTTLAFHQGTPLEFRSPKSPHQNSSPNFFSTLSSSHSSSSPFSASSSNNSSSSNSSCSSTFFPSSPPTTSISSSFSSSSSSSSYASSSSSSYGSS